MQRSRKRLLTLLAALPLLLVVAAMVYMVGMAQLEGESRGFWQSLGWAAETLSTTGYGADVRWQHPVMVVFVVLLQFLGVFLVFLIFPIYLIPVLEERFEAKLPTETEPLSEHVIIYRYGPAVATLLDEAAEAGLKVVVAETDAAQARRLVAEGVTVVYGRLEDRLLERCCVRDARAVIANGTDDENATVILNARQLRFEGEILAMVEEPYHRRPMMLAGATAAFTPRHILGAALAARASERISPKLAGIQALGRKIRVNEIRIDPESDLAGKTLKEADIGRQTGLTVIGQWVEGRLFAQPTPDLRIEPRGILIVVGSEESLERFSEAAGAGKGYASQGKITVAGFGEVGAKVVQLLRDVDEDLQVIDRQDVEGVDRVGDVLDPGVLESGEVASSRAVILALDSDSATMFATVILKDVAPDVPVIARVNRAENVERIHRAGAEFALSISQISGQMLARRLLGEEAIALDPQLKLVKVGASGLTGEDFSKLGIRERTGCSVVAVERGEDLIVELPADFRFEPEDAVFICGSSVATRNFAENFPTA